MNFMEKYQGIKVGLRGTSHDDGNEVNPPPDEQFVLPWGESMQPNHKGRLFPEGEVRGVKMPPVKIYSRLFNEEIYVVADQEEMEALLSNGVKEVVYMAREISLLKEMDKEKLTAIHSVKKIFPGAGLA